MQTWLKDTVFYEIYPQSFKDTNGDGIGDFQGIIEKLPYIKKLGCNGIWLNPCFDSPFKDAGYDVRDYKKTAERYGTNEDLERLFSEAHRLGIRVLLDLVPGHTSEEHAWFKESCKAEKNAMSDRYIWTDSWWHSIPGHPYIGGEAERDGCYMLNFFKCQPALNYGWKNPAQPWQSAVDSAEALATIEALKDNMRFWLDRGCDGFRVDMADSLVKEDDEQKSATSLIWQEIRRMLDKEYPDAVMVSEWGEPRQAIPAGFDMDFYLDHAFNGYNTLLRDNETPGGDHSFFKKDAGGDINRFLDDYLARYEATDGKGYISFITGNHDCPRVSATLTPQEEVLAWAFLLTMPGVPFIYYGDEICLRYISCPTKEGGYTRTGTRRPMQWNQGKNLGFSSADERQLYLPLDSASDAPTVEAQEGVADSPLETVRALLALRHAVSDLQADAKFRPFWTPENGSSFAYLRGEHLCVINPTSRSVTVPGNLCSKYKKEPIFQIGKAVQTAEGICVEGQSFAVFEN